MAKARCFGRRATASTRAGLAGSSASRSSIRSSSIAPAPADPVSTGGAPTTKSCMRGTSMCASGELQLRGKLVLPDAATYGPGPYPTVVIVHGSESYSAVDYYYEPYLYAANGFAALA